MKPRTLREKEVAKLSKKLGSIGKRDEKKIIAMTYGTYDDMYKRAYAVINQSFQGWQVLRWVRIERKGRKDHYTYTTWEVVQAWSKMGEGQVIMARKRSMGYYLDNFAYDSDLEIRRVNPWTCYLDIPYTAIYHKSKGEEIFCKIDDEVEKGNSPLNLTRRRMYQIAASSDFPAYFLRENIILGVYVAHFFSDDKLAPYLPAFKIVARHHYKVEQPQSYMDYLNALVYLGKDLHNPFYVCPANFQAMHDTYIEKMAKKETARKRAEEVKQMKEDNEKYQSMRSRFFGLEITDGTISCHVLQSVEDFFEEGETMHHCVYKCKYYQKVNSLILSARINGKRVETVEYDLKERRVIQAYGACDKFTDHHEDIVRLVNSSRALIESYNNNNPIRMAV